MRRKLRVAAYAVCVRDVRVPPAEGRRKILLARSPAPAGPPEWVLPGGGVEHGEDPYDTVRREVFEETGYHIEVTGLLGVDSLRRTTPRRFGRGVDRHALRLVYEGRITGGELRNEVNGSTDLAAWQDLAEVDALHRVALVDTALGLWRERPASGRLPDGPGGLLLPPQMNTE
ncbi:NUDIX hydrolase [Streptomyces sp. NPDC006012]|uniref:NUDIX hydrolase n=1 Tax=Streptomyces sp. NPDC006012 TaxID=3364739 RepID=UPI00367B97D3